MKYYFFRDLDNGSNLLEGKTYHASGYVEKLYCDLDKPNHNGKDLAVSFFEPFNGSITSAWRSVNEVELFEVDKWEYDYLVDSYNAITALESESNILDDYIALFNNDVTVSETEELPTLHISNKIYEKVKHLIVDSKYKGHKIIVG